jgi:hypothetical protein
MRRKKERVMEANENTPAPLTPEAKRALAEADARRKAAAEDEAKRAAAKEIGGQKGPEPTRYGDWEKKGIVSDF